MSRNRLIQILKSYLSNILTTLLVFMNAMVKLRTRRKRNIIIITTTVCYCYYYYMHYYYYDYY